MRYTHTTIIGEEMDLRVGPHEDSAGDCSDPLISIKLRDGDDKEFSTEIIVEPDMLDDLSEVFAELAKKRKKTK